MRRRTLTEGHLTGMSTPCSLNREPCRNECSTGLGTLWGTLLGVGPAEEVSFCSTPPHPLPHDIGEEVEWRPLLLYANPLGHRIPATLNQPKTSARCMRGAMCGARGAFVSLMEGRSDKSTGCSSFAPC